MPTAYQPHHPLPSPKAVNKPTTNYPAQHYSNVTVEALVPAVTHGRQELHSFKKHVSQQNTDLCCNQK